MSFSIGDTIDAYQILEELGRGGMGSVFKVQHTLTRRLEAMKILEGGRPDVPGQAARSLREIQVQAGLDHPSIAKVHNAFWLDSDLILVMELIEGCSLRRLLEQGRMPLATAIDYACQALSALSYAHAHGVIHRDVSPANMMISSGGVLKLTDFGLSKGTTDLSLSQPGAAIGSLYYMSPEQVRGTEQVTGSSDIYSLGAVLYELATGKKPFEGDSAFSLMVSHVEKTPAPPIELDFSLPAPLSEAILRSLAKDPAQRYPSAEEFRRALAEIRPSVRMAPRRTPVPRRPWMFGTAAASIFAIMAATVFLHQRLLQRPHNQPAPAAVNPPAVRSQKPPITANVPPVTIISPVVPAPPVAPAPPAEVAPVPHQANDSHPHIVAKRRPNKPDNTAKAIIAAPPALGGSSPTISSAGTAPPERQPVVQIAEPPSLPPVQQQPVIQPAELSHLAETDAEPAPKPGTNGVKKGLGKFWRLLRHKKSASENNAALPSDRP